MSNEENPYPSRLKKKKNRSNSILNIMIGLVFALILIIGVSMLFSGGDDQAQDPEAVTISPETEDQTSGSEGSENGDAGIEEEPEEDAEPSDEELAAAEKAKEEQAKKEAEEAKKAEEEKEKEGSVTKGGTITREDSNDPIVEETVINTSWEPVGTKQKGDHVSVYQKDSVDWNEKVNAVSYATGLDANNMYVMMIKNGGGPQKSIATVQSKDESQKYRVHMEWVDGEGWKPVKMDVLNTLQGAY